jgi:hypothetical protein
MPNRDLPLANDSALAPLVADFYDHAPTAVQTSLLRAMLRPVGPLAMVALAAGAFGKLLPSRPSDTLDITPELVSSIHGADVLELARYVEQKAPELLEHLPETVGSQQVWAATASGALLLAGLSALRSTPGAAIAR